MKKKLLIFRAGPTWMRRGTQGHVTAPRGPTQRLRGVYIYILFTYFIYNGYSAFRISEGFSNTLNRRTL